jgi:glycolate oxidase
MTHPELLAELRRIVGERGVVSDPDALMTYNADGCVMDTHSPDVVVLPTTTEQVVAIVKLAAGEKIPVIARGAGTGLSGGATPMRGGIVLVTARMEKILEVDTRNNRCRVQPGVINFELTAFLKTRGYQFAADPSSQKACTIGGNIANNSGGPHCIKYGVTGSHVLGVQMVLADGSIFWTGEGITEQPGYDLTGITVGAEGTTCVITEAWLKILPLPEATRVVMAIYNDIRPAAETVSAVIAGGFLPAALEVMDTMALKAVNDAYKMGIPDGAGAALIIEVDGVDDGLDDLLVEIVNIAKDKGAIEVRPAKTPEEQVKVWAARKNAFGAMGRLAPTYHLVDTVVPRTKLPAIMDDVKRISKEVNLPIANVFHAGDGNLHPIVLFDSSDPDQSARAHRAVEEVMRLSIAYGGVISGEHGIGIEKQEFMPFMFNDDDLGAMAAVHAAFDPFDLLNPGKIFPSKMNPNDLAATRRKTGSGQDALAAVVAKHGEKVWI